jgi:hypothetical protein
MTRPIVLPELPPIEPGVREYSEQMIAIMLDDYARAAVEADRAGIVVTDEDLADFNRVYDEAWDKAAEHGGLFDDVIMGGADDVATRVALESFAARLRGTP